MRGENLLLFTDGRIINLGGKNSVSVMPGVRKIVIFRTSFFSNTFTSSPNDLFE